MMRQLEGLTCLSNFHFHLKSSGKFAAFPRITACNRQRGIANSVPSLANLFHPNRTTVLLQVTLACSDQSNCTCHFHNPRVYVKIEIRTPTSTRFICPVSSEKNKIEGCNILPIVLDIQSRLNQIRRRSCQSVTYLGVQLRYVGK